MMQVYLVGGAVRDGLLGLPFDERDWVVVGATAEQMQAEGFVPADADFPVFNHPQTGEEYALARRETKRGEGYRGFVVDAGPDVTLEEDLRRRDLTINAMAQADDGTLFDPYRGREDLDAGLLRHVSPAFVEDPSRVLRIARFAARLGRHGFRVAHPTHRLLRDMVARGDMAHVTRERLWREMVKAMPAPQPWRFFEVLQRCGALAELIPPLAEKLGDFEAHGSEEDSQPIAALKRVSEVRGDAPARLAAILLPCVASMGDAEALLQTLRADRETAQLLRRVVAVAELIEPACALQAEALLELIKRWRGLAADSDIEAPAAIIDAQRATPVLLAALPVCNIRTNWTDP